MPSAHTILTRYADEVGRSATASIQTGTDPGDPDYAADQLQTDNPAQVAKIDSTTGAWVYDFGSAQRVDLAAIIHHDFDAGADVKLQGHATSSWGSPSFEQAFTIPAWKAEGTRAWPVNPWLDLTTDAQYSASGFRYWRLVVTGNSQNLQLGAWKLYSSFIRVESDFRPGLGRAHRKPIIENRTAFEVATIYHRNTTLWMQDGTMRLTTAQADVMEDQWYDAAGRGYPFVIVPNGLRNICYFVRRAGNDFQEAVQFHDLDDDSEVIDQPMSLEEVGRGLRPGV
jgi:hypothetical protein